MDAFGVTHRGLVRSSNQDCFEVRHLADGALLALICDGMGGPGGGEVAAAMAAEWMVNRVTEGYSPRLEVGQLSNLLTRAAQDANREIYNKGRQMPGYSGMGTTVVAALLQGGTACVLNAGDSRAYLATAGQEGHRLLQITHDHSVVQEMVDEGSLTDEQARVHPRRNIITRALGISPDVTCDCFLRELQAGDRLLLCSDGLTNMVEDAALLALLARGHSLRQTAGDLLQAALDGGARDNVTALLVGV